MIAAIAVAILTLCALPGGGYARQLGSAPEARAEEIAAAIVDAANDYGVDPALLAALAWRESGFDPSRVSKFGAFGLFQAHPRWWGQELFGQCMDSPSTCLQSQARIGAKALAYYLYTCRTPARAVTAYRSGKCGPTNDETRKVLHVRAQIRALGAVR